jgi:UDP-2,3-diacylglucosamine pyrophosphatase LpxH
MSSTTIIISDLHMSTGDPEIEAFRADQEERLVRMLAYYATGRYRDEPVELIINGDWLDFLFSPPFLAHLRYTTPEIALQKLAGIVPAHERAFAAVRAFLGVPGKRVTVLLGNHDIELRFAAVRAAVVQAIFGAPSPPEAQNLRFWMRRVYQPYPDVYIEHGNAYDAYNIAPGLYDIPDNGPEPPQLELPFGSVFVERVYLRLKEHFPYLDRFDPPLSHAHFLALLLVLDKPLVIELLPTMAALHAHPDQDTQTPDAPLPPQHPLHALLPQLPNQATHHTFIAALTEMRRLRREAHEYVGQPAPPPQPHEQDLSVWIDILSGHPIMALHRLFAQGDDQLSRQVATGAYEALYAQSGLRWAIMGHTHQIWRVATEAPQTYLNTGTWGTRVRLPKPAGINEQLFAWLQHPMQGAGSLQDATTPCFVRLERASDAAPTSASFLVWDEQGERPLREDELDGTGW